MGEHALLVGVDLGESLVEEVVEVVVVFGFVVFVDDVGGFLHTRTHTSTNLKKCASFPTISL